ncbi:RtcB family protein [Dialister sp.]|uniref:RtcB family protein n=1 Tax=Dialister sp. TaxID=1955814 RepID=UPI002E813058|nr:RtcB family protein [Dialister sp.]MEE3453251.1 RtcB family protein [Dialister sp.]
MEEIKGTVTTAISYAKTIDPKAREQIQRMCSYEVTRGSRVRIMPDVHFGKGCTIGTTMTIIDKAVPNIVGVDLGCGMYTVDLGNQLIDYGKFDEAAHFVPSGFNVWDEKQMDFDLTRLFCYEKLRKIDRIGCSLGTLGGGNHFIEIEEKKKGGHVLVIHSGSRNLGKQVAELYQRKAVELIARQGLFKEKMGEIIARCKAEGWEKDIQREIQALRAEEKKVDIPEDLCYLSGKYLDMYLHDVAICQLFARLNRETMAKVLLEKTGLIAGEAFHTIHNYIDVDERILRKGAIAAHRGEKVLIPINMRDGSILAIGKGNPEWNNSAPHGAGRLMSRMQAKKTLTVEEYQKEMEGIYTTSVNQGTLDEAPMAYKSMDDILSVLDETAEVLEIMKPVYNFKAGEE